MKTLAGSALVLLLIGCASTPVDMNEPRRIVGTENAVRVDAQVTGEEARPGQQVPVTYEITNQRSTPIAVADLIPQTTYDAETRTFTVTIGSEVPGQSSLPRLIEIAPGEKRAFSIAPRLAYVAPERGADPLSPPPPANFRLMVNFLGKVAPFQRLVGIKETAVIDPKLADELFPLWVERNEVVFTNSVPMRWLPKSRDLTGVDPAGR
jgi:hypothetical protein